MKKLQLILISIISILTFTRCDDETAMIGSSIVPDSDTISYSSMRLYAKSKSIMANDSILANSSRVYLGRFTDPETNTVFTSDFIAQFNCVENYGFPDNGVIGNSVKSIELKLFFNSYFGDSLNTMKCEVYELDNTLEEGIPYYTNIDPTEFYNPDKAPLATKVYCAKDETIPDSIRLDDNYTPSITIKLPNELGERFISKYYEKDKNGNHIGKINFSNSEEFINNVFKGVYVKSSQGDGTVLYISMARLNVSFDYFVKGASGEMDSITSGIATFSSTQEVLQVNKFNNGNLKELVENETSCTHLRTPAGVFTEVELPIDEIMANNDTINSVKIKFTRYNSNENNGTFKYTAPSRILMVRKSDMYSFFLKNKLANNVTSYTTTLNPSSNEYEFNNISRLINYCVCEYETGTASDPNWASKNPDWNKVVLIPISIITDSNGNIVAINHNLSMTNTRLRGGENDEIAVDVITSKFNN